MSWPVLTPAPGKGRQIGPALMAVATSLDTASAAVAAGADIIDFTDAPAPDISAFLTISPGVPFCAVGDDRAALTRHAAAARNSGARLICRDLAAARASGLPAHQLIVHTMPAGIGGITRAGYAALIDADADAALIAGTGTDADAALIAGTGTGTGTGQCGVTGCVAVAALSSWLGAALIRTRHPLPVRRALDMTAIIVGARPPARTVRGLA